MRWVFDWWTGDNQRASSRENDGGRMPNFIFYTVNTYMIRYPSPAPLEGRAARSRAPINIGYADEFLNGNRCPGQRYSDGPGSRRFPLILISRLPRLEPLAAVRSLIRYRARLRHTRMAQDVKLIRSGLKSLYPREIMHLFGLSPAVPSSRTECVCDRSAPAPLFLLLSNVESSARISAVFVNASTL